MMQALMDSVRQDPTGSGPRWSLAEQLFQAGDIAGARREAVNGVRLVPTCHKSWTILGACYNVMGDFETAKACFDRAVGIAPGLPTARWNRSFCHMAEGDWENAWRDYEAGRQNRVRPARLVENEWHGEDLEGKTLLVWGEQGFGDQIQFARYIRLFAERGARVVLEVSKELVWLMQGLADEVCAQPDDFHTPYQFDYHSPLLSLPYKFGVHEGYWGIPDGRMFEKGAGGGGTGFCWKGRPTHPNDHNRSASDEDGRSLLGGHTNLTFGTEGSACGNDLAQLAETVMGLDRVVTVDTALAHLAGSMGKDVVMVPPLNNEGRWGYGETTCWYPTMRIVRGHKSIAEGLKTALEG